jgi:hypothetical protein
MTVLQLVFRARKDLTEHRLGNLAGSRRSVVMLANGALNSYREMTCQGGEICPLG